MLVGTHDFATFGQPTQGEVTVRTLYRAQLAEVSPGVYHLDLQANGFLRHMVRRLTALLVEVGQGRQTPQEFEARFRAADLSLAGVLAPPQGLILVNVQYLPEKD
ncbi:MAG: hypothetical protein HC915_04355 [Anaerolineae bacterium]|nr:hypothetical protein [Anaerolineae bacterium]